MAIIGFPYNSQNRDRAIKAEVYRRLLSKYFTTGVFPNPSTQCQVVAGGRMNVTVKKGSANINGLYIELEEDVTVTVNAPDTLDRYDRIVLRNDDNTTVRAPSVVVIKGTPSESPQPPALTRNDTVYDICLATVKISQMDSKVEDYNIEDTRSNTDLCGIVSATIESIDTTTFYNQIQADLQSFKENEQADFQEWFDTIKGILGEDEAGNLLYMIQENTSRILTNENDIEELTQSIDNVGSKLNSEVSRATTKENELSSRIDNFTTLTDGSTTGDAELQDIRVGYDGIIYKNAGEAVRNQINDVNSNINDVYCNLNESMGEEYKLVNEEWTIGYWKTDGTENTTNDLFLHIKIPVFYRDKIMFSLTNTGTIVSCVFLDINNNVVSYFGDKENKTYTDYEVEIPNKVKYVCLSTRAGYEYNAKKRTLKNVKDVIQENSFLNLWAGKKWVAYGDSITAISNSDKLVNDGWTTYVNKYLNFGSCHGRGIGGSGYRWKEYGGSATIVKTDTGMYVSRNDDEHKETYTGSINEDETLIRSCFCSWDRITHMIPEFIKDDVDLIFIMGGTNDNEVTTPPTWENESKVDIEWAESEYYSQFNGDYNIETMQGGLASCVMKLQLWCPNAIIVIGTPLASRGETGKNRTDITDIEELEKAKYIKEVSEMLACPCVNVYGTSGINPLNRTKYITDTLHPYSESGKIMLARAVISGLSYIQPIFN